MDAPAERTPLEDFIARAQAADQDAVTSQRNRALIRDMAVALVAQAKLLVDYQKELQEQVDDRRIVLPGT